MLPLNLTILKMGSSQSKSLSLPRLQNFLKKGHSKSFQIIMFLLNLTILKIWPLGRQQINQSFSKLKTPFFTMAKVFKIGSIDKLRTSLSLSNLTIAFLHHGRRNFQNQTIYRNLLIFKLKQISQFLFSRLEKLLGLDLSLIHISEPTRP